MFFKVRGGRQTQTRVRQRTIIMRGVRERSLRMRDVTSQRGPVSLVILIVVILIGIPRNAR
jgi:hypothetical protein